MLDATGEARLTLIITAGKKTYCFHCSKKGIRWDWGPIGVMLLDHDRGRQLVREMELRWPRFWMSTA